MEREKRTHSPTNKIQIKHSKKIERKRLEQQIEIRELNKATVQFCECASVYASVCLHAPLRITVIYEIE